jgi:hypothetical protein
VHVFLRTTVRCVYIYMVKYMWALRNGLDVATWLATDRCCRLASHNAWISSAEGAIVWALGAHADPTPVLNREFVTHTLQLEPLPAMFAVSRVIYCLPPAPERDVHNIVSSPTAFAV